MISSVPLAKRLEVQQNKPASKLSKWQEICPQRLLQLIFSYLLAPGDRVRTATVSKSFYASYKSLTEKGFECEKKLRNVLQNLLKAVENNKEYTERLNGDIRYLSQNVILNLDATSSFLYHYTPNTRCILSVSIGKYAWFFLDDVKLPCGFFLKRPVFDLNGKRFSGYESLNPHTAFLAQHLFEDPPLPDQVPKHFCLPVRWFRTPDKWLEDGPGAIVIHEKSESTLHNLVTQPIWNQWNQSSFLHRIRMAAGLLKTVSYLHEWGVVHGNLTLGIVSLDDGLYLYVTELCHVYIKEGSKLHAKLGNQYKKITEHYDRLSRLKYQPYDYAKAMVSAKTDAERQRANNMLADFPTDIWHLGTIFCNLFFNGQPFLGETADELVAWGNSVDYPYRTHQNNRSAFMNPVIFAMFAKEAKDRPNIQKVIEMFLKAVSGHLERTVFSLDEFLDLKQG